MGFLWEVKVKNIRALPVQPCPNLPYRFIFPDISWTVSSRDYFTIILHFTLCKSSEYAQKTHCGKNSVQVISGATGQNSAQDTVYTFVK